MILHLCGRPPLDDVLRFGAEDMYNYSAYPALFVFKDGAMDHPYYGGREVEDFVFYMSAVARGQDPEEEEKKRRPGLVRVVCPPFDRAEVTPVIAEARAAKVEHDTEWNSK